MIRLKRFGCGLLLSAAVLAGETAAQGPRSGHKEIIWKSPANSNDIQVGILGEIATPGVYHVDAASLSVQALVRRAGGLTEDATQSIRIVRQERVAQSVFFSPQTDSPLMPGDVLIVESKRSRSAMSKILDGRMPTNPIRQVSADSADPTGIQVAYVNVLDAPVVVKLHLEDARLERVVQMLGQPIELAGAVKVIEPQKGSTVVGQIASGTLRLTDGTVLIFPRGSINRNKLPPLPKPHDSEITAGAMPSMIGGPFGQSPELRSVGQMVPLMSLPNRDSIPALNPVTTPHFAPDLAIPAAPSATQFDSQPAPMPIVSNRSPIATVPFTGAAHVRRSSSLGQIEPDAIAPPPQDELPPQTKTGSNSSHGESARTSSKLAANRNDLTDISDPEIATDPAGATPFTAFQMCGILAGASALIGLALLARKHFDKQSIDGLRTTPRGDIASPQQQLAITTEVSADTAIATEMIPPAATPIEQALAAAESVSENKLDRLIRNELPLREEAAVFPDEIVLQGQIAPRPIHRLDRAAESALGSGPHFATSERASRTTAQGTTAQGTAEMGTAEMELDTHPSAEARISGPHFGRRRRDARPITIGEASRAAETATREAAPSTPLADALRQLQGDRPS